MIFSGGTPSQWRFGIPVTPRAGDSGLQAFGFLCCLHRFCFCLYRVDDNRLTPALRGCCMNRA